MTKSTSYGTARPSGGAQRAGTWPDRARPPGRSRPGPVPIRAAEQPTRAARAGRTIAAAGLIGSAALALPAAAALTSPGSAAVPSSSPGSVVLTAHDVFGPGTQFQRLHRGPAEPGRPRLIRPALPGSGAGWAHGTACTGHPQPAAISHVSRRIFQGGSGAQRRAGQSASLSVPRSADIPPVATSPPAASRRCVNGAAAGQRRHKRHEWRLVRGSAWRWPGVPASRLFRAAQAGRKRPPFLLHLISQARRMRAGKVDMSWSSSNSRRPE